MLSNQDHATSESLVTGLRWVCKLRWVAAVAVVGLAVFSKVVLGVGVYVPGLIGLAVFIALYNIVFVMLLKGLEHARPLLPRVAAPENETGRRRSQAESESSYRRLERFANLVIAVDLLCLTGALHFSGGAENPFFMFYVFHVIIASILLTARSSFIQATLALALFSAMTVGEYLFPGLHRSLGYLPKGLMEQKLVLLGEIAALGTSLYIAGYLASTIARRLHQRERELRQARDSCEVHSKELERTYRGLAEIEERKSQFMKLAAHQLRAPLAAIRSSLQNVTLGYARDEEQRSTMIKNAERRAGSMLLLVNDLLTLARAKEPNAMRQKSSLALEPIVKSVVEFYRPQVDEKGLTLELHLDESVPSMVMADHQALSEAISNLVSNAVKYTPEGGRVKVECGRRLSEVHCTVSDTGIGIPDAEKSRLFTEFFRGSNARKMVREGTGLGLAIVREIVNEHGGEVELESKEGSGTRVIIRLPLHHASRKGRALPDSVR